MSNGSSAPQRKTIAVVGNPNCGKTTVFNGLTSSRQRIGNWPGVTVEKKVGEMRVEAPSLGMVLGRGVGTETPPAEMRSAGKLSRPRVRGAEELHTIVDRRREMNAAETFLDVIDLPGIYSLSASSEDEIVARDFVLSRQYDLVVSVIDAANLERNLYLTLQLIEMDVPVLVVLNMTDRAEAHGIFVDADHLATHLGCPVVPSVATTAAGIRSIRQAVEAAVIEPTHPTARVTYAKPVEEALRSFVGVLQPVAERIGVPARYIALRLFEGDRLVEDAVDEAGVISREERRTTVAALTTEMREELDIVIADGRYGFIHGVSRDVVTRKPSRERVTEKIDNVVMHRWPGAWERESRPLPPLFRSFS